MSLMQKCDGPRCDTWSKDAEPMLWLRVVYNHRQELWFHTWECAIQYGACLSAPTEIPAGGVL